MKTPFLRPISALGLLLCLVLLAACQPTADEAAQLAVVDAPAVTPAADTSTAPPADDAEEDGLAALARVVEAHIFSLTEEGALYPLGLAEGELVELGEPAADGDGYRCEATFQAGADTYVVAYRLVEEWGSYVIVEEAVQTKNGAPAAEVLYHRDALEI